MRVLSYIIWCLLISSCSSDGVSTQTQPDKPVSQNVEISEIDIASNDCIMRSNAEIEFTFDRGSNILKHMIWNCTDYDFYRKSFVELHAEYDIVDACYKVVDQYIGDGICSSVAKIPDAINFQAEISDPGYPVSGNTTLTVYPITRWPSGYPGEFGVLIGPFVTNTGNVRIFGLQLTFAIDGQVISQATMTEKSLPPFNSEGYNQIWNPIWIAPMYFDTPIIISGGQYTLTLTLKDLYGNVLDTYTGIAEAQF